MSTTYIPHRHSSYTRPYLSTIHHPRTWSENQAALLLSLRDISNPPTKNPDVDVRRLEADRQIHARWTDPDLVGALSRLQNSLPPKANLSFKYGGRDVTDATWVLISQTLPQAPPELAYVLWFHEYDDLDVEVGELSDVYWGVNIKKEEEDEVKMDVDVGVSESVEREVKVKMEEDLETGW